MILAAALLILAPAAGQSAASVAGLYQTSQMEMGAALELQRNGHFRYQLDYGAASESAEGDWSSDGTTVRLTSKPIPKQPDFAVVRDEPAPVGELYVAVEDSRFGTWTPLSVVVKIDGIERPVRLYAQDDGRVVAPDGRQITSVKMLMPVYETGGDPVQLGADRGHRLLFKLRANDMGKAAFRAEPLAISESSLVMHRYDTEIIFRRAEE